MKIKERDIDINSGSNRKEVKVTNVGGEGKNSRGNESGDKELTIDNLDELRDEKVKGTKEKDTIKDTETKLKKEKSLKRKLLESLDEESLSELLLARETLREKNQILEDKGRLLVEYEDLLKRKVAELENYRKRVQREMEDIKKYATGEMVLDILNIIDDFERAVESARSSKDFDALLEGILITEKQLRKVLEAKYGVKKIESVGKEFDPSIHEAVMMEESEEFPVDMVIEDLQKGYKMHDRIIRPAKVKVAKSLASTKGNDLNSNNDSKDLEEAKPS